MLENKLRAAKGPVRIKPQLTVVCLILSAAHFVLGVLGYINLIAVIVMPLLGAFLSLITYTAFASMIKTDNYDMLAGFDKKKDGIEATRLQLYWGKLFSDVNAIIFEVLFTAVYFIVPAKQMDITILFLFVFLSVEALCFIIVSVKVKARKQ